MKDVTEELLSFSHFLNKNFDPVSNSFKRKHPDDDYLNIKSMEIFIQANWEILVEMQICIEDENLEYYNSGADLFTESYRVVNPQKNGNTKIMVSSKKRIIDYFENQEIAVSFFEFIKFVSSPKPGFFSDTTPFDYIIAEDTEGRQYLLDKNDLIFLHSKIE